MKPYLQDLALHLFTSCLSNRITVDVQWIPRTENQEADAISKMIDYDDWETTQVLFQYLNDIWGPHTIDRFADNKNAKVSRFNSRFWCPGTECVDAFSLDWSNENNYLVPPVHRITRVIYHAILTKSTGTLIVPWWPSAPFWPLLFQTSNLTQKYVHKVLMFSDTSSLLKQGNFKKSLLSSERFTSPLGAFRISAAE